MSVTYHVKIKKEYAEAVLADLEKMEAVELSKDENDDVPEWQKDAVRSARAAAKENPSLLINEKEGFKRLNIR